MLRILQVIATLDRAGAEKQLVRLCLGLDRSRFRPAVCCLTRGGPYAADLRAAGVPVWILGKRGRFDLAVLGRLCHVIRAFRPHIVHTWLFTANCFGRTAALVWRVPVIIGSERAADVWKSLPHRLVDRILSEFSDAVVVNAQAVGRFAMDHLGVPESRIVVVYNGLDLAEFDAAAAGPVGALPPTCRRPIIGVVARLEEQKGLVYLLRAFALLHSPAAQLWIVGDGPLRRTLEGLASALGIAESVFFLGTRSDVPAILRQLDLFVLSSLWEGLPNAVMEAMAAARAVVATAVDGTRELVVPGETGLLVPPRDSVALARAIEELLNAPARREAMGNAGRDRIARKFGEEKMILAMERLYSQLAESAIREGRRIDTR